MKKVLATILGLTVVSGVYADSYIMYAKPDTKSSKLATIDDQDSRYKAIFSKGDWIEVVDNKDGSVGWVKQKTQDKSSQTITKDPIEQMMTNFQKQQQLLDEHFNKMLANIDQSIAQMQAQSSTTKTKNNPQVFKKFSSITIDSDGKTAKIVKKSEDGNGDIQTVEKEIPADQLGTIKL
ncbi:hypothetical protein [Francisella hispaniensis]|uniref:Outer membrane protein 26 n=1 Tax=Francisella hispaniensis TaxID=622488 RepID=F4BH77_9GAMM|nr:hypothetical protein [Francisella hispaniensis]AEE26821.1 Outer membrane protein 26 [Francisella hispaniensis]